MQIAEHGREFVPPNGASAGNEMSVGNAVIVVRVNVADDINALLKEVYLVAGQMRVADVEAHSQAGMVESANEVRQFDGIRTHRVIERKILDQVNHAEVITDGRQFLHRST